METKYKGYTIKIEQNEYPENPREWDNLGTMYCVHSRYTLGDQHNKSKEEIIELIESDEVIYLPLYLYDHSGITMNTAGFSCPWDSGRVGFIAVSKEKVRKEYGWKLITKEREEKIKGYLRGEVETYDQYLTGDVYGYIVEDEDGEHVDSCWGFYDIEEVEIEAKSIVDYEVKKHGEQLKMELA